MSENQTYIFGKQAVTEALTHAPLCVLRVFLAPLFHDNDLHKLIRKRGIKMGKFTPSTMPKEIALGAVHQGIIAQISLGKLVRSYNEFINGITTTANTALVLLGEIQDPQNVGGIVRSAAAFGISGVLIPEHNQASITGAVVKVSAGMVFNVPLIAIGNVNNTIRDLKDRGFWIYGLEGESDKSITAETFDAPAVFILGNEAKGIRMKTRELCDILLKIPMRSECESLNVAASSAVALYAWSAQHQGVLHMKIK